MNESDRIEIEKLFEIYIKTLPSDEREFVKQYKEQFVIGALMTFEASSRTNDHIVTSGNIEYAWRRNTKKLSAMDKWIDAWNEMPKDDKDKARKIWHEKGDD